MVTMNRLGAMRSFVGLGLSLIFVSAVFAANPSPYYTRKGTWAETMFASRAAFLEKAEPGDPIRKGPWYTTGPLSAENVKTALFPEKKVSLDAQDEQGQPLWTPRAAWGDGKTHTLAGDRSSVTYLFRTLSCDEKTQMQVDLGGGEGVVVWLNGKKVHASNAKRDAARPNSRLKLKLKAGDSTFLVKLFNSGGEHSFCFTDKTRIPDPASTLWRSISLDFKGQVDIMKQCAPKGKYTIWLGNYSPPSA